MERVFLRNKMQQYIYDQEKIWVQRINPYVEGKVLKVGSGLGYMTSFIRRAHPDITVLETRLNSKDPNQDIVQVYDGINFPYDVNNFDCAISRLVLHHTPQPTKLIHEMARVSKRIVIFEETYTNTFSKIDLCARDIYVNTLAGQPSRIYWRSYFQEDHLIETLKRLNMHIVFSIKEPKRSYFKQLYVLEKEK